MIVKMSNKDDNFYKYMGKFFGSRIVQTETRDRIYDDNNKLWYIYIDDDDKASAFVSVANNVIKNIYSTTSDHLYQLLLELKNDLIIQPSIVTNLYEDVYAKCNFIINRLDNYKYFIMIWSENNGRN